MRYMKATIELLIPEMSEGEAADCIAETLREHCAITRDNAPFIDWRYLKVDGQYQYAAPHDGEGFEIAGEYGPK